MLVRRYQYADYYSGVPVRLFLLWRTSHLYDTFLGGLRQYQYADYPLAYQYAGDYHGVTVCKYY